jgi:hypothetical protein
MHRINPFVAVVGLMAVLAGAANACVRPDLLDGPGGTGGGTASSTSGMGGAMCSCPDDMNPCTDDACTSGMCAHPPKAAGLACDATKVCDGNGKCTDCLDPNGDGKQDDRICGNACPTCPPGGACTMDAQCDAMLHCTDGVCCDTTCTDTCRACNVAMLVGTCSFLPQYDQDTSAAQQCTGSMVCNGAGGCLKANGEVCLDISECASGKCTPMMGGMKTCTP